MSTSEGSKGRYSRQNTGSSSGWFSSVTSGSSSGFSSRFMNAENIKKYNYRKSNESSSPTCNPNSPRRLQNLGNTCYFNATIQILAHCRLIINWVRRSPTKNMSFENENAEILFGWRILRLLEYLLGNAQSQTGIRSRVKRIFSNAKRKRGRGKKNKHASKGASELYSKSGPMGITATKEALRTLQEEDVSPLINGRGQQDSHEFLRLMYSCLNAADVAQPPPYIFSRRRIPFASLITGETTTRRTCSQCGTFSNTAEAWTDLSVPIIAGRPVTDCLDQIFETVQLQGENAYECSRCNEKVDATQEAYITQLPPVLTLQLQRFAIHGQQVMKVLDRVNIPQNFSWSTSATNKCNISKQYFYTISGIVSHVGQSINCGHYVSYVKNRSDEWFKCDDLNITAISEQKLINDVLSPTKESRETPYLLLYEAT